MNTQDNHQENQNKYQYQEDEIDIRELFAILWKGKWLILSITFIFAIASVGIALWLPNEYKATVVVQAAEKNDSGKLASLAGSFGGLASLAGIDLSSSSATEEVIAVEIIQSWGFIEDFIKRHDISVPVFAATGWDESNNKLIIDEDVFNTQKNQWVREPPPGKTVEPTSWELYQKFKERLLVVKDPETGLLSISLTYYSPELAKKWVDYLLQDINKYMKEKALDEANKSIQYLEEQINKTSLAEIRTVFSELIQEQHKTKMLAQISDEYVFKTVSRAKAPEERDKPNRALICIIGTLLGGFLSVLLVLISGLFRKGK
ncbi:MAG: Wzz/FepE/Etk N-terminal domain-containing protein [Kangiella sp.]|jgi:LPS O-antigen subunit length determinant protein (WzzB/FepE family)|nr:Wzz/FepE/Etk N-terminal domain-containing protein [Kangiella sp.]